MNRPIRNLAIGCLVLFLALMINVTYLQYWQADDLTSLSQHSDNSRVRKANYSQPRGAITAGGRVIAESKESKDQYKYLRFYPAGPQYAAITGFFAYEYGPLGVEASQSDVLSGEDPKFFAKRVVDVFRNETNRGGTVAVTIDPAAQQAAFDGLKALGDNVQGSVVAIEPSTGKILAMVSSPSYEPNNLAGHDFSAVRKVWDKLVANELSPLNNRAIEETLPPGSTFKLVTAAAALESGKYGPDTKVKGGSSLDLPLTSKDLVNEGGSTCGGDPITLRQALEVSCNVSFGSIGLKLGASALREQARKFGFEDRYFFDLDDSLTRQSSSEFVGVDGKLPDRPQTAFSAIGQSNVRATPLQMAMVAAGIANGGKVMRPYLVDEIKTADLEVIDRTQPSVLTRRALSPAHAAELTDMMVSVVDNGTGTNAQIPGYRVAGKTGTAQSAPSRPPYAWFVSFADAGTNPKVAVAVLVQNTSADRSEISGNGLAAPIAKAVMEAILNR